LTLKQLPSWSWWNEVKEVLKLALEEILNSLGMVPNVLLLHKGKFRILNELPKTNHKTPRVWSTCLEPFKEDLADLFIYDFSISSLTCLSINEQNNA
jgi:hypothetical protein